MPPPNGGGYLSLYAENSLASGAALEVFIDNVSVKIRDGVFYPDPTASAPYCMPGKRDLTTGREAWLANGQRRVPVTAFNGASFRAVRSPGVADDSANPLATQIYDHGWRLAEDVIVSGAFGTWPPPADVAIVPVTGSPVVDDGRGVYGFTTATRGAGTGTIRHILSGAGGSTRQIATILDRLAATTPAQRASIAGAVFGPARGPAMAVVAAAYSDGSGIPEGFLWRWCIAANAAQAALGLVTRPSEPMTCGDPGTRTGWIDTHPVRWAMLAFTAKEHLLTPSLLSEANYIALTAPLRAVITLPSGY